MKRDTTCCVLLAICLTATIGHAEDYSINVRLVRPSTAPINEDLAVQVGASDLGWQCYTSASINIPSGSLTSADTLLQLFGCTSNSISLQYNEWDSANIYNSGFYNTNGTTWENAYYSAEELADVSFPLLGFSKLSGVVWTEGQPLDAFLNIEFSNTAVGGWRSLSLVYAGSISEAYNVTVPATDNVYLRYRMIRPLEGYVDIGYWSDSGTVYDTADATPVAATTDHNDIDFQFLPAYDISGMFSLPVGVDDQDTLSVQLQALREIYGYTTGVSYETFDTTTLSLSPAKTSLPFTLKKPGGSSNIILSYWLQNSSNYVRRGHYSSTGSVGTLSNAATFTGDQDYNVGTFSLMKGNNVSGVVILPPGTSPVAQTIILPPGTSPVAPTKINVEALDQPLSLYDTTLALYDNTLLSTVRSYATTAALYDSSVLGSLDDTTLLQDYDGTVYTYPFSMRLAEDVQQCVLHYNVSGLDIAAQGYRAASGNRVTGNFNKAGWIFLDEDQTGINLWLEKGLDFSVYSNITWSYPYSGRLPIEMQIGEEPLDANSLYWTSVVYYDSTTSYYGSVYFRMKLLYDATDLYLRFVNSSNPDLLPHGYYGKSLYQTTSGFSYYRTATVPTLALAAPIELRTDTNNYAYSLYIGDSAPGDINFDGELSLKDVVVGLQIATSTPFDTEIITQADVNGDGVISMVEVLYVMQQVAGNQ